MTIPKNCGSQTGVQKREIILRGPPMQGLPKISLGQHLLNHMRAHGDHTYYIDIESGVHVTAKDILIKSVKLATDLKLRGIGIGDRVSISSENHMNYVLPACATLFVGGVVAPLNPAYTEWELKNILSVTKPKIVFVSRRTEAHFVKIAASVPWSMEIIELDDEPVMQNVHTLKQILEKNKCSVNPYTYTAVNIGNNGRRPAAILCSSGTTGFPKGVTLTHRNFLAFLNFVTTPEVMDMKQGDKLPLFLPLFHGYAFGIMLMTITSGATALLMKSFNFETLLGLIQKYRISHLAVVPPILILLAKYPLMANYDCSSVREILCGAAPLPTDTAAEVKKRLNCTIRNAYGMTELSIITNICDRSDDSIGSVGYLVPGTLCKVIDQQTHETLGEGQIGELCFKGETVMLGYYNNTEATIQTIDEEGWLHTGDLGYYDEKQRFYICGRVKELIKYKGFQVSPSEIETVLLSHSGVKDAAVIGKPDEVSGEVAMAFVVRQPGSSITAEEIIECVKEKLSPQKWLRGGVRFIQDIPRNPSGKILRLELAKMITKL